MLSQAKAWHAQVYVYVCAFGGGGACKRRGGRRGQGTGWVLNRKRRVMQAWGRVGLLVGGSVRIAGDDVWWMHAG